MFFPLITEAEHVPALVNSFPIPAVWAVAAPAAEKVAIVAATARSLGVCVNKFVVILTPCLMDGVRVVRFISNHLDVAFAPPHRRLDWALLRPIFQAWRLATPSAQPRSACVASAFLRWLSGPAAWPSGAPRAS